MLMVVLPGTFFCVQHSPWEAAEEKFGKLTKLSEELFPFA